MFFSTGLLDIEYELQPQTVCSRGEGLGGMIRHIAVHPDYQKMGVGHQLLQEGENEIEQTFISETPELYPVQAFAHYVGRKKR